MSAVVPHQFLFRFSIPVHRVARLPKRGRMLLNLPTECRLPAFGELDDVQPFGELRIGWNEKGVGVSVDVRGKRERPRCRIEEPTESDGLQLWVDTRNTQSIHRASRFCHHFCVLPAGAGGESQQQPASVQLPIARAREDAPLVKSAPIGTSVQMRPDGYQLEVWLPAESLNGFDPEANPSLGFYYLLQDSELGEQFLTVGREFPFAHDPSLWCTLELIRE